MLKHCAANRKRQLSVLPNAGPYIYDVSISGFTRSSIYIYIYMTLVGEGLKHIGLRPAVFGATCLTQDVGCAPHMDC